MDRDEILRVLGAFEEEGLEYVLVGAAALGFHGIVRATEDLDLFIRATVDNVARLRRALRRAYADDPNVDGITAEDLLGEYPAVRYYPPSGDLYFDIMTRLGEAATYETVESEIKEIEGVRVPVATARALYDLKKDRLRPLDRQDAAALGIDSISVRTDMGVEKFRSVEEMNAQPPKVPADDGFERFIRHCARYRRIAPLVFPRGVFKFRTIEEAQRARAEIARGNASRLRGQAQIG